VVANIDGEKNFVTTESNNFITIDPNGKPLTSIKKDNFAQAAAMLTLNLTYDQVSFDLGQLQT